MTKPKKSGSPWWAGPIPIGVAVLLVAALIGVFVLISRSPSSGSRPPVQAPPSQEGVNVVQATTGLSGTVADIVGTGGLKNAFKATHAAAILTGASGRPLVLYVGAEFCPYCAAQRWSLVAALGRFGSFQGLQLSTSSSSDVFPNTATFSFLGSSYSSSYLDFTGVETSDRNQKPLQQLTPQQYQVFNTYNPGGSIPFTDIGNRFVGVGSGFAPEAIQGKSWQQIAGALSDPTASSTRVIVGNANYMTSAICAITGQQPAQVCGSVGVKAAQVG
jgi:hypothetical protein